MRDDGAVGRGASCRHRGEQQRLEPVKGKRVRGWVTQTKKEKGELEKERIESGEMAIPSVALFPCEQQSNLYY